MKIFFEYLKFKKNELLFAIFVSCVFLIVFFLYGYPTEVVLYGFLIIIFVWLILYAVKFTKFCGKHKTLELIKNEIDYTIENLPECDDLIEHDYNELINTLFHKKLELYNQTERQYNNMLDYYTIWAHQIKTPISAMSLMLQTEDFPQKGEIDENLRSIEQYVDMVMCYLRLESRTNDFVFKRYDLDRIIKQAIKKFSSSFIRRKIRLDYKAVDYMALTDEKWLLFVIEQVISNSIKYTKSGEISIFMAEEILYIKDTGIGIADEDLPLIFEKGYTGKNGRENKKASGIGLYICKKICEKLGHKISANSKIGEGTTIMINLKPADVNIKD